MKPYKQHFNEDEIEGGLSDNLSCQEIADKHGVSIDHIMTQLNKGIKIEMEHTDDEELAKEIAKDHITEYPYYYDELEKMEKKFENNRGIKMKRYKKRFEEEDKLSIGDKIVGALPKSVFYRKTGKIIRITDDMVIIDFGNGDIYGIMKNRIIDGQIIK